MSHPTTKLAQLLQCFICLSEAKSKVLCPKCQRLACRKCMERWIVREGKRFCPHCRGFVTLSSLIPAGFLNDFGEVVARDIRKMRRKESTPTVTVRTTTTGVEKDQKVGECKKHVGMGETYYCVNCKCSCCSDCAMFDVVHRNHEFKRLESVWSEKIEEIRTQAKKLDERLTKLNLLKKGIGENIIEVSRSREKKLLEMSKVIKRCNLKINSQMKSKMVVLIAQKNSVGEEIKLIKGVLFELSKQIQQKNKLTLIRKTPEIIQMLLKVNNSSKTGGSNDFKEYRINPEFTDELVPLFNKKKFKINNFLSTTSQNIFYSHPMIINGVEWKLKVYTKGSEFVQNRFLSCFIEASDGIVTNSRYEYKIEILNSDPKKNIVREFSSVFADGESWGYNRFLSTLSLENDGFVQNDGSVSFVFYVRSPSFLDMTVEMSNYIQVLLKENAVLEMQNKKLLKKSRSIETTSFLSRNPILSSNTNSCSTSPRVKSKNSSREQSIEEVKLVQQLVLIDQRAKRREQEGTGAKQACTVNSSSSDSFCLGPDCYDRVIVEEMKGDEDDEEEENESSAGNDDVLLSDDSFDGERNEEKEGTCLEQYLEKDGVISSGEEEE